jgi:integrase
VHDAGGRSQATRRAKRSRRGRASRVAGFSRRQKPKLPGVGRRRRPYFRPPKHLSGRLASSSGRTSLHTRRPDKPETVRRYSQVLEHFERLLGTNLTKGFIESITRADMDDYEVRRRQEQSQRHKRLMTPRTINFEISPLRTVFYYLINELGVQFENPCTRFKQVRDVNSQASRRPPTYTQDELKQLFEASDAFERPTFATLLMTGLRKKELYFLTWRDADLRSGVLRSVARAKLASRRRRTRNE